jgi:cellulose synthase/poly-beta-1,6-N-acetylglucosamine synthase-like glycosyltransferase
MRIFYFFGAIVIWLGFLSLRAGFRFAAYVRREIARPLSDFTPFASIIAPCRGLEDGLRDNLAALFDQEYPAYEIIFVSDRGDDQAITVVNEIIETANPQRVSARVVIAGEAVDCGQKVHNLRAAIAKVDPRSEVLVFVDTDARPLSGWLRSLVSPFSDKSMGAVTGYRWFIPDRGGFASPLRSVWNASIASALGDREDKNFCWGGSTAILKSTFNKLQIPERWRGTVSDDFTLTRVLQEAKLPIHFAPACIVPSFGGCTLRELLEFTNRQLKITRVYAPHLWKPLLAGSLLFCSVFFGGLILIITRALLGLSYLRPLAFVLLIFFLGAAKAYIRLKSVAIPLAQYQTQAQQSLPAHLLLWPLASGLYLYNALTAAFSRRITWRGITYELKSPTEAVIISRASDFGVR